MPASNKSLNIKDLRVAISDKQILKGVSLSVKPGEIHAIMGPNGSGKSTLAASLMGHPDYTITSGKITLNGTDITGMSPDERARHGLFLGFQYPVEVPGVSMQQFLRLAASEKNPDSKPSPIALRRLISDRSAELAFSGDISARSLNVGFSGGEKKKSEILQLAILKPDYAVLDEPDSGLDVDALKYISKTVNSLYSLPGLILITHYQRILHYIKPDFVHILVNGRIVKSGTGNLAGQIEESGYEQFMT